MSARLAAYSAIVISLLALIACGIFLPTLISKINTITSDLEMVGVHYLYSIILQKFRIWPNSKNSKIKFGLMPMVKVLVKKRLLP